MEKTKLAQPARGAYAIRRTIFMPNPIPAQLTRNVRCKNMKNKARNRALIIGPILIYRILLSGFVTRGWIRLTSGTHFSSLCNNVFTFKLFNQIPHAIVYFFIGWFVSMQIRSDKKARWILLLCLADSVLMAITVRYHFDETVGLLEKLETLAPYYITPWFAWLAYVIYRNKKDVANQRIQLIGGSASER